MLFKNPAILYSLFFLIIPILVHLFQLQKFELVKFTNVQFLKKVEQQSRKSSKLKKLLLLLTRLLLLAFLILAFAQPYIPSDKELTNKATVIFLDNSWSMSAKGQKGILFEIAKQELVRNFSNQETNFTLLTNDETLEKVQIGNQILNLNYTSKATDFEQLNLKINQLKSLKGKAKNVVLISDFQNLKSIPKDSSSTFFFVQTLPERLENFSVDSLWIKEKNNTDLVLEAKIRNHNSSKTNLNLTLWVNEKIEGKSSIQIQENEVAQVAFTIKNSKHPKGKLVIDDPYLKFDNEFYFTLSNQSRLKVLCLGERSDFINKIYQNEAFEFSQKEIQNADLNQIETSDFLILNELKDIPNYLISALEKYVSSGKNVVIIPAQELDLATYNQLFQKLGLGKLNEGNDREIIINQINFEHPFFKDVFKAKERNFNYPKTKTVFNANLNPNASLLSLQNGKPFLSRFQQNNGLIYWFSSPLNTETTNFSKSPLVVPTFYNFSLSNSNLSNLYYRNGIRNEISVGTSMQEDQVVLLKQDDFEFIPLQVSTSQKVILKTDDEPDRNGLFDVLRNDEILTTIAFNYPKQESEVNFSNLQDTVKNSENQFYFTDTNQALNQLNELGKSKNLWQLFLIFASVFLIIEMLIQQFMKN